VRLKLRGSDLPSTLVGATIVIDNQTRSDASYRIRSVLGDNWIDIGRAAIEERHVDPDDYDKGLEYTIREGDSYRIGLTHRVFADVDLDGLPDTWEFQNGAISLSLYGSPGAASSPADFDGDSFSDADEWQAGTDPSNPACRFTARLVPNFPDAPSLQWQSRKGRNYRVWETHDLKNWIPTSEYMEGNDGLLLFPLPTNQQNSAFWLIEVKTQF
jgi:hypothetical protein